MSGTESQVGGPKSARGGSKNAPNAPRRRRPKCGHPSCGKFGHYTSQCWIAHPELRNSGGSRGWGKGRDRRGGKGKDKAKEPDDWTTTGEDACPDTTSPDYWDYQPPPPPPFRLLDLPQELQVAVYRQLYDRKYHITAAMLREGEGFFTKPPGKKATLTLYPLPSYDIELACKKMRHDSHTLRKDAFSGLLRFPFTEDHQFRALYDMSFDGFAWIRERVTTLSFEGFNGRSMPYGEPNEQTWESMLRTFPKVQEINFHYTAYRYQFLDRDDFAPSSEWYVLRGDEAFEAFRDGKQDGNFSYPARLLSMHDLAKYTQNSSIDCKVYMTTHFEWIGKYGGCAYKLSVKFLVTANGLEAVVRKADGKVV